MNRAPALPEKKSQCEPLRLLFYSDKTKLPATIILNFTGILEHLVMMNNTNLRITAHGLESEDLLIRLEDSMDARSWPIWMFITSLR